MTTVEISFRADVKRIEKKLSAIAYQQLPFATAQALNALAQRVKVEETQALNQTFDKPTPFTLRAFGVIPARKDALTATVFARDIQAAYLTPYEIGGRQVLGKKKTILNPKGIRINQYGNIPKGTLQRMRGKGQTFSGAIKTRSGKTISGVWQRTPQRGLKLLVRYGEGVQLQQRLNYRERAQVTLRKHFKQELGAALAKAIATAK